MQEDVIWRELKLVDSAIVQPRRRARVRSARLGDPALVSLEEATERGVLLCTQPVVGEVLQRGQELNNTLFNLRSDSVFLGKEADQVLVHAKVGRIDHATYLWGMQDAVVVDLVQQVLEVLPGR